MIEIGYNGIEFGKYSSEYFLNSIPKNYVEFFKKFTHRDTQERGTIWRVQGTISIENFNTFLKDNELCNISSIKIAFPSKKDYLITLNVINLKSIKTVSESLLSDGDRDVDFNY